MHGNEHNINTRPRSEGRGLPTMLKIIKRVLDSLPPFLEYMENGEELNYIPEDYSWSMKDIISYPKSVPEVYEWLENAIKGKNRYSILISILSIFYMTYML